MVKNAVKTVILCSVGLMICSFCGCDRGCKSCCCGCMDVKQETKKQITEGKSMRIKSEKSPLEWEIIQEGTGETPKKGQTVIVHYTGWLDEGGKPGKKFDSSVDRGQKFSFTIDVGQVIKGWDEGVLGMKKGEKRRLYIPASLGYGARGAGAAIPPNADLIFDVELFDMN